jgi:hypothetical protein
MYCVDWTTDMEIASTEASTSSAAIATENQNLRESLQNQKLDFEGEQTFIQILVRYKPILTKSIISENERNLKAEIKNARRAENTLKTKTNAVNIKHTEQIQKLKEDIDSLQLRLKFKRPVVHGNLIVL